MITVNDMYKDARSSNAPLLSNYEAPFWSEYVSDFSNYDRVFNRLYKSFEYFLQEEDDSVSECRSNFTEDVKCLLIANSKKYSELYRTYKIDDSIYSLTDNYDVTETYSGNKLTTIESRLGSRTDNTETSDVIGSKTDSIENTDIIGAINNTETMNNGAKNTNESITYGAKNTNESTSYGAKNTNESTAYGAKNTNENTIYGSGSSETVGEVSPMDSNMFYNNNKNSTTTSEKTDSKQITNSAFTDSKQITNSAFTDSKQITNSTFTDSKQAEYSAFTDSKTINEAERTNTSNNVINSGEQNNSSNNTYTKGEQSDTHNHDETESYNIRKRGNIGVQTATDMISKHNQFWNSYEFYTLIFKDICKELLSI